MPWDYDKIEYKKQADKDPIWRLERHIMYEMKAGATVNRTMLQKYLKHLKIPENRRAFLELLAWNKPF